MTKRAIIPMRVANVVLVGLMLLSFLPARQVEAGKLGKECTGGRDEMMEKNEIDFLDACDYTPPSDPCAPGGGGAIGGSIPVGGSVTLEGHTLPADHGGTGLESEAYIDGGGTIRLKFNNASLSAGNRLKGKATPADAEYYSNMRLRYVLWSWRGHTKLPGPEKGAWYFQEVRKMLIINPRTKKAVVTALVETGPAPWGGTTGGSKSAARPYWQGFIDGTPPGYNGRVAGMSPAAFKAIEARQWMFGGPGNGSKGSGDDLLYRWAPDQTVPSGTVYSGDAIPETGEVTGVNMTQPETQCPGNTETTPGGIGISADGFVFPLQTNKKTIEGRGWPTTATNNRHHHYNAADIFAPTGTIIVASRPGSVIKTSTSKKFGQNVQIKGDDGLNYYYNHMPIGKNKVHVGDTVKAGDPIGEVGTRANANGTPEHLHFDITQGVAFRPNCSGLECQQNYSKVFVLSQPILAEAFKALPE